MLTVTLSTDNALETSRLANPDAMLCNLTTSESLWPRKDGLRRFRVFDCTKSAKEALLDTYIKSS